MTITDTRILDLVATRSDSSEVKLIITDHLPWDDVDGHCVMIQEKINAYLGFVESGQIQRLDHQPLPASPEYCIALYAAHQPPTAAAAFLSQAESFLSNLGVRFECQWRPTVGGT